MPRYTKTDKCPKSIVVYDNGGKTTDRYTIVDLKGYVERDGVRYYQYGYSSPNPYSPQGVGSTDTITGHPWRPGDDAVLVEWDSLPEPVRKFAIEIANWSHDPAEMIEWMQGRGQRRLPGID